MRYRIPLKLLVIKNNMLNQIAWEQMMFLGNPQFACELQPIDFALAAEAMGGIGYSVTRPEDVDGVLDAAFAAEGPVIIEAVVDAYEPMLPRACQTNIARTCAQPCGKRRAARRSRQTSLASR